MNGKRGNRIRIARRSLALNIPVVMPAGMEITAPPITFDAYREMTRDYARRDASEKRVFALLERMDLKTQEDFDKVVEISQQGYFLARINERAQRYRMPVFENYDRLMAHYEENPHEESYFRTAFALERLSHKLTLCGVGNALAQLPNVLEIAVHNASSVPPNKRYIIIGSLFESMLVMSKDSCVAVLDQAFDYIARYKLGFEHSLINEFAGDGDLRVRANNLIRRITFNKDRILGRDYLDIDPGHYGIYCRKQFAKKLSAQEDRYIEKGLLERPKKYGKQNDPNQRPAPR